jgi:sortase (surface protein transpeptidase)
VVASPPKPAGPAGADHLLTLTTCTPKGSASHRLIIQANMIPQKSA